MLCSKPTGKRKISMFWRGWDDVWYCKKETVSINGNESHKGTSGKSYNKLTTIERNGKETSGSPYRTLESLWKVRSRLEECVWKVKNLAAALGKKKMDDNLELPDRDHANHQARGTRRKLTDVTKLSVHFNSQNREKSIPHQHFWSRGHKADLTNHFKKAFRLSKSQLQMHFEIFRRGKIKWPNFVKKTELLRLIDRSRLGARGGKFWSRWQDELWG